MRTIVIYYLVAINIMALFAYGLDKFKSKHSRRRISESTLLLLAALGGSAGAWCGMKLWRHKTLHKKFRYGIPAIFIIQLLLCLFISY